MGAHYDRALILYRQHRPADAVEELKRELAEFPNSAVAHALMALCEAQRRQHATARALAERAIALDPSLAYGHFALAWVIVQDRNFTTGRPRAFELDSPARRTRRRLKLATAAIQEALRLSPQSPHYHSFHAAILLDRGDRAGALRAVQRGLAIDPGHQDCRRVESLVLAALGRFKAADTASNTLLSLAPDRAASHRVRGMLLLQLCQYEQAMEHLAEAMRLDPNAPECRRSYVRGLWARQMSYRVALRIQRRFRSMPVFIRAIMMLIVVAAMLSLLPFASGRTEPGSVEPDVGGLSVFQIAILLIILFRYVRALLDFLAWLDPRGRQIISTARARFAGLIMIGCLGLSSVIFAGVLAHKGWRGAWIPGVCCATLWIFTIIEFIFWRRRAESPRRGTSSHPQPSG